MSGENGNIQSHTLVLLLREIRDRLGRIEGLQSELLTMLARHPATVTQQESMLALSPSTSAVDALVHAVTAVVANQQKQAQILNGMAPG